MQNVNNVSIFITRYSNEILDCIWYLEDFNKTTFIDLRIVNKEIRNVCETYKGLLVNYHGIDMVIWCARMTFLVFSDFKPQ